MIKWLKRLVLLFSIFCINPIWAATFPLAPVPFQYVNDYTNTLSANEKAFLEQKLQAYGKETSSQIAVVIIPSTEEYDIAQYAFELGDKWGIGRKQLNNGVLMLIAKQDRKMFIAVGQGLEGVLVDAFLSQLIRQQITPHFKQGDYAVGINQGLNYLIAASKGEFDPNTQLEEESWERFLPLLMIAVFILFVLFGDRRRVVYVGNGGVNGVGRGSSHYRSGGFGGGSSGGASVAVVLVAVVLAEAGKT